jgi:hypothetical protein
MTSVINLVAVSTMIDAMVHDVLPAHRATPTKEENSSYEKILKMCLNALWINI